MIDPKQVQAEIERVGYYVFKGVLSLDKVAHYRKIIDRHFNQHYVPAMDGFTQPNALNAIPEIEALVSDENILKYVRMCLGMNDPVYTNHCDVYKDILSGWHKDDGTRVPGFAPHGYFEKHAYDAKDCKVYRVAIYLQDHDTNDQGFSIYPGSHHNPKVKNGQKTYLPTKAGDIVIFDVRLSHTGQQPPFFWDIIKKFVRRGFLTSLDRFLSKRYIRNRNHRNDHNYSIFFTYGLNNEYTINFSKNNMFRQISQDPTASVYLRQDFKKSLQDKGVLSAQEYFSLNLK